MCRDTELTCEGDRRTGKELVGDGGRGNTGLVMVLTVVQGGGVYSWIVVVDAVIAGELRVWISSRRNW